MQCSAVEKVEIEQNRVVSNPKGRHKSQIWGEVERERVDEWVGPFFGERGNQDHLMGRMNR